MPRTLRFEEEGAACHALNRENYRAGMVGREGGDEQRPRKRYWKWRSV